MAKQHKDATSQSKPKFGLGVKDKNHKDALVIFECYLACFIEVAGQFNSNRAPKRVRR